MRLRWLQLMLGLVLSGMAVAAPAVKLDNPWIRAMPPGSSMYAAYVTVTNQGSSTVIIRGAESPVAQSVDLHRSSMHDGMSHMQAVGELTLQVGQTLSFVPGGLHLMLNGVTNSFALGDKVTVCLVVREGKESDEKVCQPFPVVRDAPEK